MLEHVAFPVARFYSNDNFNKRYSTLVKISITFSLIDIGIGAFEDCISLKQITIPSSVTSIQNNVFQNCKSLISVTFPSTLTSIGSLSFSGCSSLEKISFPSSLAFIGDFAFKNCTKLCQINMPHSLKDFEYQVFKGCLMLNDIKIPSHIGIYKSLECNNKEKLLNRKNVETFGDLDMIDSELRISVVGLTNVGKSQLISRYLMNINQGKCEPAISLYSNDIHSTFIYYYHPYFDRILLEYFVQDFIGIMLVFDLSNRESLEFVLFWYKFICEIIEIKNIFILVGNRCNLNERISNAEINKIVSDTGLPYFEISTLDNQGINEAIDYILSPVLNVKAHFASSLGHCLKFRELNVHNDGI